MRILSQSRSHFTGTHKGHEIHIERERPPVERLGGVSHFSIYVQHIESGLWAYHGYAPVGVTTMAQAKREALEGSQLKVRT